LHRGRGRGRGGGRARRGRGKAGRGRGLGRTFVALLQRKKCATDLPHRERRVYQNHAWLASL
jgi:hypothetical protein